MKKVILLLLLGVLLFSGCATWHENWALANGYIRAEDCPEPPPIPTRQALPHPRIPTFATTDSDGNPIEITERYLIEIVVQMFGTVEKFQYLVEIYEREYLNEDGKIMPDLTLEELKKLYQQRIGQIQDITEPEESPEEEPPTTERSLGASTPGERMTLEEFRPLFEEWNRLQEEIR